MTAMVAGIVAVVAVAAALRRQLVPRRSGRPRLARRHRGQPRTEHWAALLDTAASEVRSGSSLATAWDAALRRHDVRGAVVSRACRIADLTPTTELPRDEAVVVHVVHAASLLGGPQAAIIDAGAALLRERARVRAETAAYAAQARLSASVMSVVPIGFVVLNVATSASFRDALVSPIGRWCVVTGALLNVAGWKWMNRLSKRAVR